MVETVASAKAEEVTARLEPWPEILNRRCWKEQLDSYILQCKQFNKFIDP